MAASLRVYGGGEAATIGSGFAIPPLSAAVLDRVKTRLQAAVKNNESEVIPILVNWHLHMVKGVRVRASSTRGVDRAGKRGRLSIEEWQSRTRYVLRHLQDPIALQRSPLCKLVSLERLAKAKYPNGVVARGRALHDLALDSLREIEGELDGHQGVAKLKAFVALTHQGMGVTRASRSLGITPKYASRTLKRNLVELLAEKLLAQLR